MRRKDGATLWEVLVSAMLGQFCPSCGSLANSSDIHCVGCGDALGDGAPTRGPLVEMGTAWPTDNQAARRARRSTHAFAAQLATTRALIGYSEADEALVNATRDVVAGSAGDIADAFYANLLAHPEAASAFTQSDGRIDRESVTERHASLRAWLTAAVEAPLDERLTVYLAGIARAHTGRGKDTGVRVRARFMVAAMSFLQTSLIAMLGVSGLDDEVLLPTVAAWNKLLMIHLDLFLAVYGGAGGTAHWY